jgi:hypothetical protein
MLTREDLESYLLRMDDFESEEVEDGMYLVRSRTGGPSVVITYSPPLLLVRIKVMDLPDQRDSDTALFRALLELNAQDIVHGAYGLEDRQLILSDTLELETLDFHELQASIESMELAASGHIERIRSLAGVGGAEN